MKALGWRITLLSMLVAQPGGAQAPPRLELHDCTVARVGGRVQCGRLTVFENRASATGRRLELAVLLLRATGDDASIAPDPVVYLVGGPGEAATAEAPEIAHRLDAVRVHRDIVLMDQRGTGASHPLDCSLGDAADDLLRSWLAVTPDADRVRACRRELEADADLAHYGTAAAMDDLDDLRTALGVPQINLIGVSYGTRAALTFLRRHPGAVRTMTLISVLPPWRSARLGQPTFTDAALERLAAACQADDRCRTAFPSFRAELDGVLSRLDTAPTRVAISHPAFGGATVVTLTRAVVAGAIGRMLYSSVTSRYVPALVHELAQGDPATAALQWALTARQMDRGLYAGMHLSVNCAEDVMPWPPAEADSAAAGTMLGPVGMRALRAACAEWPGRALDPAELGPVTSGVPALLFSGEDDPVTPPAYAEEVRRGLPSAVAVTIRGWAHAPAPPCEFVMIGELIEHGGATGLTDRCAGQTSRLPFETAVPAPR